MSENKQQMDRIKNINVAEPKWGIQGKADIIIHGPDVCAGRSCVFHNPSSHHMRSWQMNVRMDKMALVERICVHGIGHPDPDSVAYFLSIDEANIGVHGCCQEMCCRAGKDEYKYIQQEGRDIV